VREFDPKRIGSSGAFFDIQKLDWLNQKYIIESIPEQALWGRIEQWGFHSQFLKQLMPLIHTRIKNLGDFIKLCDFFFINDLSLTTSQLLPKNSTPEMGAFLLQCLIWRLDELEDWSGEALERASHEVADCFGVHHKKIVMALLFPTIMGKQFGPPLFDSVTLLGKDRTRVRMMHAIELLGGISNKCMDQLKKGWEKRNCQNLGLVTQ
jgi:glutamyl-tRNA synthetase